MYWIRFSALLGASAVLLGAFGAHALKSILSPSELEIWKTAVQYHFIHVIALMATVLLACEEGKSGKWPCLFFSAGIFLFSGSLYILALTHQRWVGLVTPIGGTLLVIGWISILFVFKNSSSTTST